MVIHGRRAAAARSTARHTLLRDARSLSPDVEATVTVALLVVLGSGP